MPLVPIHSSTYVAVLQVASFVPTGQLELEMETEDGGIFLQAVSHSSPKHHRTSSLLDSPGSASASNSFSGGVDSSLPVGQNGSYDGGMKKPASGTAGMTLELPEFASMLPLECSFSESAADDAAAAPTPHTPVVLSVFEGEGLKVRLCALTCTVSACAKAA